MSSKNEESLISENLPSVLFSNASNDPRIMEEIKELITRENFESNPVDAKKSKDSTQILAPLKNGYFQNRDMVASPNKDSGKFRLVPNKRPIYGNLLKWVKGPRLGFGVFGDVVKAINQQTGELLAVKRLTLHRNLEEYNKEAIDSLKSEINILKQIDHKNVIKYIGSEIIGDEFCIYLEYASEGSLLNSYKEFGPFDEDLIKKYTKQIVEGL